MARATKSGSRVIRETTGALPVSSDSKGVSAMVKGKTTPAAVQPVKRQTGAVTRHTDGRLRQTDGAYMPITGPITNVHQLTKSKTVAKGSPGSFATLADYSKHLHNLSLAELHRHAIEEMRVTPIDDTERLIKRLESEWTDASNRLAGDNRNTMPTRIPFTPEQLAKQEAIRRKMLGQR